MKMRCDRRFLVIAPSLILAIQMVAPSFAQGGNGEAIPGPDGTRSQARLDPRSSHWFPRGIQTIPPELSTLEGIMRARQKMRAELSRRVAQITRLQPVVGTNPLGPGSNSGLLVPANAPQPADPTNGVSPSNPAQ